MPGHIDNRRVIIEVRKTEFDGDTPFALLAGTIRVDARQSPHQLRFSVVDVTSRSNDGMHEAFFLDLFGASLDSRWARLIGTLY